MKRLQECIFDPNDGYGFLDPNNYSGIAIPDVAEAEAYYSIMALSIRQIMDGSNQDTPLMFQKEISSDGNVNTVDVCEFYLFDFPVVGILQGND